MKKNIIQLSFLNQSIIRNNIVSNKITFRNYSNISVLKLDIFCNKIKKTIPHVLMDIFYLVLGDLFSYKSLIILNKCDKGKVIKYNYTTKNAQIYYTKKGFLITKSFNSLPFRFEIKIIKKKIVLTIYYTNDACLQLIKPEILYLYEKKIKKILKSQIISP